MRLTEEEVQIIVVRGKRCVHICGAKRGLHNGGKSWANIHLRAWNCSCAQRHSQEGNLLITQIVKPSNGCTVLLGCTDSTPHQPDLCCCAEKRVRLIQRRVEGSALTGYGRKHNAWTGVCILSKNIRPVS